MGPGSEPGRAHFDELVDELLARDPALERAQMMGMPSVKRSGKLVAGFAHGELVVKLPDPAAHARALAIDGAHLFDPSGKGRPFREWVAVPFDHEAEWSALIHAATAPS